MYDSRNKPQRTLMSHYLRTGQKIGVFEPDSYKSEKGLSRANIILMIKKGLSEPDRSLAFHYFLSSGTFDLVRKGLLPYITRSRVFQRAKDKFFEQVEHDLLREAAKLCDRSLDDYLTGRKKSTKRFHKKFSVGQRINFTNDFFHWGIVISIWTFRRM